LYYVSVDGAAFVAKTVFPYDITGLTDGLHTVRLVASDLLGTCKDTATASFTVTLTPCIAVAGINTTPATTQTLATNKFDFFNTTVVNGFGWISANSWDFGDGTTSTNTHIYGKTYAAAGTYTVTLVATMSPGGCTSIATQVVTVTAATAANFTVTPNTCGSKVVGFTSTSTGATTYSWNFGDGSPAVTTANPNHTYASDGSYTVTLTINGSVVSTPQTVHVVSNPVVGPIVNAGPSACGNTYTFSNVSTGVNLSYAWTFGGAASTGSTSTTASANRSYSVAGAATVDLVVSADGRCPVSATQISFTSVVGGGSPVAGVTIAAASVPAATSKSVNNTSTNATLYAVSIDGGAFTAQTVFPYDITGLSNGAHTVRLVAAAAGWTCKDTATASFTVTTTTCVAVAGFNVSPSSSQPLGTNKFDFFNTTQHNGFGWITDYDWDFGDGTQDLTNTFVYGKTYASVGTYTVTLTAVSSTGCTSTYSSTVTVTPSASASFTYTPNTCGSLAIAFNSSGSVSASSYLWNFGDGNTSTSANPTHTYAAAGSYTVTLTINGTTTSAPQTVVVAATPTAATITPTVSSCGNVYTYTGSATGSGITYTWAFSNLTGTGATTGAAVTRTYSAAGTDNVTLTATSGACSATATLSGHAVLQVGAIIDANLSITAANGCNGTRTVNHTSTGATSYEVSVDGGAYVVNTVFPYDITGLAAGAHTVALKAINGLCSDIETVSFNVGSVTAAFTATPGSCNSTVAFTNTTTTTFGTPTYAWTFPTGTPSTSTATSPSTDYGSSGTKSATLVATLDNGCSTSVTNSAIAVVGSGGPVASFNSSMIVGGGCNTGVQFTSTSTGATTYTWNYGDGTVSVNSSNPTIFHAYSSVGTYNVTLTASNGTCSSTSATTPVVVTATGNAVPEAAFNIINRPAVQCITGNRYDFFNTTQLNGWGWVPTYSWDFGDGTTSTATMAYGKTYATAGTYTVTLTAVSNLGCSATATMDVTVNGLPCAGMIAGTTPGNYDGPNTYGAATTIASGVEESADISNKVGLYPNPTRGNFRLTIENVKGNKATITIVDMLGREVYQHNYNILGTEYIDINDLNLAEGKYNLVLRSNSDQVARKSFAVIK
jgi:PKD repeat protein